MVKFALLRLLSEMNQGGGTVIPSLFTKPNSMEDLTMYVKIILVCALVVLVIKITSRALDQVASYINKSGFKPDDHLYIMHAPELQAYKIGRSINPENRRRQIERETGVSIDLIRIYRTKGFMEKSAHHVFSDFSKEIKYQDGTISREWFNDSQNMVEYIKHFEVVLFNVDKRK